MPRKRSYSSHPGRDHVVIQDLIHKAPLTNDLHVRKKTHQIKRDTRCGPASKKKIYPQLLSVVDDNMAAPGVVVKSVVWTTIIMGTGYACMTFLSPSKEDIMQVCRADSCLRPPSVGLVTAAILSKKST